MDNSFITFSLMGFIFLGCDLIQLFIIKSKDDDGSVTSFQTCVHIGAHLAIPLIIFAGEIRLPWQAALYHCLFNMINLPLYCKIVIDSLR